MSDVSGAQAEQVEPPDPHAATLGTVQAGTALQHPVAQLAPSHAPPRHTPAVQVCAAPHAGPFPQRHVPLAEQRLALLGSQVKQVSPLTPQVLRVRRLQVAPAQQPDEHDVASQTHNPLTQRWPPAHAALGPQRHAPPAQVSLRVRSHEAHAPPVGPQLDSDIALHVPPAQQPPGHEVASHAQAPLTHRRPIAQVGPVPQPQNPVGPQTSAFCASHARHADPRVPQVSAAATLHCEPAQQPSGHEV